MTKVRTRNCHNCPFCKAMINPQKGVKIPGGSGKCIHPGGPERCRPLAVKA